MYVLGLTSPISENTAACLTHNGRLLSLVEEERFVGIKHAPRMIPRNAIRYCLDVAGLTIDDVDLISFGFKSPVDAGLKNFIRNIREWNRGRTIPEAAAYVEYFINMRRQTDFLLSLSTSKSIKHKYRFVDHHLSHAASAARCSGVTNSVVLTLDGVGEDNAGMIGHYRDGEIVRFRSIPINQSLGWFYSEITSICGFKSHSHEGKTMGLAAYGNPDLELLKGIACITPTGYRLSNNFASKIRSRFQSRSNNQEISQIYKDLAATAQHFLEEAVLALSSDLSNKFNTRNLCLAGGVALNCDMNFRLTNSGNFDNIYVQPAANDAGTALGSALEVSYQEAKSVGKSVDSYFIDHAQYGPSFTNDEIEHLLIESKISYRKIKNLKEVAQKIAQGKIVGWFRGRMEFGPRALGGRSILANPSIADMKDKINAECKHRENWRPFAPSVLDEYCNKYFENYHKSPFMLMTFKVKSEYKDVLAATIHVDDTARVQEVTKDALPDYYELIKEFEKITGVGALLDTSFNDKEKPICLSPREAIQTFFTTGLDVLVIEDFILEK